MRRKEHLGGEWKKLISIKCHKKIFPDKVILDHEDFAQFTPFPGEGSSRPTFAYLKVL